MISRRAIVLVVTALVSLFVTVLSLSAFASVAHAADGASSTGTDQLFVDRINSPVWEHDFVGSKYRELSSNGLFVDLEQRSGGFDTAIQGDYSIARVDQVSNDYAIAARLRVDGGGSGEWWYGPKLSVNWVTDCGDSNGCAGWFENYVIEKANISPAEYDARLGHGYLGSTFQDGSEYKHYRTEFSNWVQFYAIRQDYRNRGTTTIKPIFEMWRANGLPNLRVDSVRINLETNQHNFRSFTIDNFCLPESFTDGSCANPNAETPVSVPADQDGAIPTNARIRDAWQGRYLHAQSPDDYSPSQSAPLNRDWTAQQWVLERVRGDIYRIRNQWTGDYLSVPSTKAWAEVQTSPLNRSWLSQQWHLEPVGDQYRIRNVWSRRYLHTSEDDWSTMTQAPFRRHWLSMKFDLEPSSER